MPISNFSRSLKSLLILVVFCAAPTKAHAHLALMLYESVAGNIFVINSGHAGVYLSNICMTPLMDQFRICTDFDRASGNTGTILQRYSGMMDGVPQKDQKDWIALPLNVSLYGTYARGDAPILATDKTLNLARQDIYNETAFNIQEISSTVSPGKLKLNSKKSPGMQDGSWKYAIGTTEIRSSYLVGMETTPEQDEKLLEFLNTHQNKSTYTYLTVATKNCAVLADLLFSAAEGKDYNGRGHVEELGMVTPVSVAQGIRAIAKEHHVPYTVMVLNQMPGSEKPSTDPGELITDSNFGGIPISTVLHLISPASYVFWAVKELHRVGLPLPGFRPYFDVRKEARTHATDDLANTSFELSQAKKQKDAEAVSQLEGEIYGLQNKTFGTKACWKAKNANFKAIVERAVAGGVIEPAYAKLLKTHTTIFNLMRMIPVIYLTPTHAKLVKQITTGTHVTIEEQSDGFVLHKDGVTAGFTRNNILNYDPRLGFLVMTAAIVNQLDSGLNLLTSEFDPDWDLMIQLGKKAGLNFDPSEEASVVDCSSS